MATLAACTPGPGAQSIGGDETLRVTGPKRITAAILTSEPATLRSSDQGRGGGNTPGVDSLENLTNAGATRRGDTDALRPELAEAAPSIENGLWKVFPDGRMETTWTLKNGTRWQDGTPFTGEDLLFTLTVSMDQEVLAMAFGNSNVGFDLIHGAKALDDRTITVTWKEPYVVADALFTAQVAMPLPKHLLEGAYQANKRGLPDLPYWTREFIGAGPFQVRAWVEGSHITLVAFDGYILGRPKIDGIVVKFIPDPNAIVANMLSGEVDLNLGRGISLDQALQIRDQWREGRLEVGLVNWIDASPQFIDPRPVVLLDVRFRKALVHAFDRQEMADTLQGGLVPIAHAYFDTSLPQHRELDPYVVKYDYDPRRAVQLIESTGHVRGADGSFRDPAGQPLSIEIRTTGGVEIQGKAMYAVADYWQRIGIDVETVVMGPQRRNDREYRATRPAFELAQLPDGLRGLRRARSSSAPLPENNFMGTGNEPRYMNPEFDALLDRFFSTIRMDERMQILGQILHHTTDVVKEIGLFRGSYPILVSNRLLGVGPRLAAEGTEAWNAREWDVRQS